MFFHDILLRIANLFELMSEEIDNGNMPVPPIMIPGRGTRHKMIPEVVYWVEKELNF